MASCSSLSCCVGSRGFGATATFAESCGSSRDESGGTSRDEEAGGLTAAGPAGENPDMNHQWGYHQHLNHKDEVLDGPPVRDQEQTSR